MWREMGVANSYTMEATFCGSLLGKQRGHQFTIADLEAMGYHFCDTLLDYCDPDQSKVCVCVCVFYCVGVCGYTMNLYSLSTSPLPPGGAYPP